MNLRLKSVAWNVVVFGAGAGIALLMSSGIFGPRIPGGWFTLQAPTKESVPPGYSISGDNSFSVSFSDQTLFESDIAAPEVKGIAGRAKFLSRWSNKKAIPLGYVVTVTVAALDKKNLPDKYKKDRILSSKVGPITELPLNEATYEFHFVFRFLDRDGFELLTSNSPQHWIHSGDINHIQAQTSSVVSPAVASQTYAITVHMAVEKCVSARSE